ncbi:MAG: hypothetical protein [Wendovervirus sonii]|uniref:Uncharacterized protein n=1 Tax=phage Lak_Megaphage_Sonny TaxID=3109229 RepID=A0ABZ0Z2X5_9CAUD|nr:MAG: hypothetical protein [phage Lak_Megaphage_Sonny]
MFANTIDNKQKIVDNNGNEIVDLTTSIFRKTVTSINSYNSIRMNEYFQMRADKIAFNQYNTDEGTEYILKYSGISNPFSLDKDDVLMIPDFDQASAQMTDYIEENNIEDKDQVALYYKFTNTDFKSTSASYDKLAAKKIPSGVLSPDDSNMYMVPYISDDGTAAVTIKNGRMYFGGVPTSQNKEITSLEDKCLTNGMTVADFVKANITSGNQDK